MIAASNLVDPVSSNPIILDLLHWMSDPCDTMCVHFQLLAQRAPALTMTNEQKLLACKRLGQAINMAVDRLLTIGEIIAEVCTDIKADMFDCCKEARETGACFCHPPTKLAFHS